MRKVCDSSKNDTSGFPRLLGIALRNTGGIPQTYIFWLWGAPSRIIKCGLPVVEYPLRKTCRPRNTLRGRPASEEYPPRKVGVRGIPLDEGLLQQQKRHQRVCEAAGNSSEEYLKNTHNLYLLALGSPVAHYQVWNTRNRPPPEEYPPRKTGVRGIPLEEDLPPEEYPLRKTWHKAEMSLRPRNTHRGRSASEEYPLRKVCYSSKNDTGGFARQLGIALRNT